MLHEHYLYKIVSVWCGLQSSLFRSREGAGNSVHRVRIANVDREIFIFLFS